MSEKVVQDSDEEDVESPTFSPIDAPKSCNGLNGSQAKVEDTHNDSSDSLKDKIGDIQKVLLQNHSAQGCEDFLYGEHQLDKGSLILPSPKRRRLSHNSNASRYYSEDPNILLYQSRRTPFDNDSTYGNELASINFQTFSQPLTTNDKSDFEQIGEMESLGDGSSTIPYGSLTQRRLMDRVTTNLDPQKDIGVWGVTGSNDIVEDDNVLSPLSSPCAQQECQRGIAQSPIIRSQSNVHIGHELLSISKSSPRIINTNLEPSSKPVLPLSRKKRFQTEPMHNTSRSTDNSDDELCFSAGILSAVPQSNGKSINTATTSCSRKNITRHDNELDDINVHDNIPKCGLGQAQCDLPRERYVPRPSRSRSRPIKVEEIDYSQSPEKVVRKQHRKGSPCKVADVAVVNNPPLKSDGLDARNEEHRRFLSTKQKDSNQCDRVDARIPASCESASVSSQDKVRVVSKHKIKRLVEMGFGLDKAEEALKSQNGHMDNAIQQLLERSDLEPEQTGLKITGSQEGSGKILRRLRKGRNAIENDESTEQNMLASDPGSCIPEVERIPNKVIKTVQVEIFNSIDNLSRDKACTKAGILSHEAAYNHQNSSSDSDLPTSSNQLSDHESSGSFDKNAHLEEPKHRRNIENGVSDNRNSTEKREKSIIYEIPEKKRRGRPRKTAKVERLNVIQVHEDPFIQADDLIIKEPSTQMDRSLTPILGYNSNNSIDTRDNEACPQNAVDDPKTPSSKSYAGIDSSPLTIEKPNKTRKQDHSRMSNHSPLSKSHVPYRVGLSRSAKITPLLRSLKK